MKRILAAGAILALCCTVGFAGSAAAADKGPAEITLRPPDLDTFYVAQGSCVTF